MTNEITKVKPLTKKQARSKLDDIKANLEGLVAMTNTTRTLVWEFVEGSGPKALGYDSMEECAKHEFHTNKRYLYRLYDAENVQRVAQPVLDKAGIEGEVPEWTLRPLKGYDNLTTRRVVKTAISIAQNECDDVSKITLSHIRRAIKHTNASKPTVWPAATQRTPMRESENHKSYVRSPVDDAYLAYTILNPDEKQEFLTRARLTRIKEIVS